MYGKNKQAQAMSMSDEEYFEQGRQESTLIKWMKLARQYHIMRMTVANTKGNLKSNADSSNYLLFGLSASTGKVMTQAKRIFGGDSDASPADFADALASVRIYVEQIAFENGINLDEKCLQHMQAVCARVDQTNKK